MRLCPIIIFLYTKDSQYSPECLTEFLRMFERTYSPECLATFLGMFEDISPEYLTTFPRIFGDIPGNVWRHYLKCLGHCLECLGTFPRMFGDIPPEYNIPPIPGIAFLVPVFLVLSIRISKRLMKTSYEKTKTSYEKMFS